MVGYSADSSTVSILAASIPSTPSAPTTAISSPLSSPNVVVSWTEPTTNGSAISSYKILFKKADNSFATELTSCNGSDSTILVNRSCTIPKTVFSASPFSLANTASVYAKITATNVRGESPESAEGNGALMAETPDAPVSINWNNASTSHTQVTVTWAAPESNGG